MMEKQNITVAMDPVILRKARALASRRGLSGSAMLAQELRLLVEDDAAYAAARTRAVGLFDAPLELDGMPLSREMLHDRSGLR